MKVNKYDMKKKCLKNLKSEKWKNLRWENIEKKNIHSNLWILNKSYNNWLEDILQWI